MSGGREMNSEATALSQKLEGYVLNLRQVEAALEVEPTHTDLIKIKADLNELIDLTKKMLSEKLNSNGPAKTQSTGQGSYSWGAATTSKYGAPEQSAYRNVAMASSSSSAVQPAAMLSSIKTLGDDQYRQFMIQAFDESRPVDIIRPIIKYVIGHGRKAIRRQNKIDGRYKPYAVDSDDDENGSGEANQCNGSAGPAAKTSAAGNAPLIYRGDVFSTENDVLFLTVKQIRLKPTLYSDHKTVAAIVCLVNQDKQLAFWGVVNWKREDICQTFPNITGVTADKLEKGLPFSQIMTLFLMAINGKLLVGYKLEEDLQALSISHDRKEDIADYFRDKDGPFAIDDLKLSLEIGVGGGVYDGDGNSRVVHETRTLRGLYAWQQNNKNLYPVFSESPNVGSLRVKRSETQRKRKNDPGDACRCTI